MDRKLQWAISKILEALTPNFYGSFTLTFQGGKFHCLKTEKTEKPEDTHETKRD
jgi:hypothetical protein